MTTESLQSKLTSAEKIINAVKALRAHQKEYFAHKDHNVLKQCKAMEQRSTA